MLSCNFQWKQSKRLFFLHALEPLLRRWPPTPGGKACHIFCSFTIKSHGCSRVLYTLLFAHFKHTEASFHSLAEYTVHPHPSFSARPLCHRLRYDFCFTNPRLFACSRKNLHCAIWYCVLPRFRQPSGTRRKPAALGFLFGEPHRVIAMKYCNHFWLTHR